MRSEIFSYLNSENQFYPTPTELVKQLVDNVSNEFCGTDVLNVLEPCAGDGAIVRMIKEEFKHKDLNIDCVEIEPVLYNSLKGQGFNMVGTDFLKFESRPIYDLIIMNPPFKRGAEFLLKAYKCLNGGGKVVCILNAESVLNRCTKDREMLETLIDKYGGVEFLGEAFAESEHKTGVKIAVVHLEKPIYENEFDLFGNVKDFILTDDEKVRAKLESQSETGELMSFDKVENAISIYRNCVKQMFDGIDTIKKVKDGVAYLQDEAKEFNIKTEYFIEVMLKNDEKDAKDKSVSIIRKMIWSYVIKFCDMDKYLFTKQRAGFYANLDKGSSALPFTKENVYQFFNNIFNQRDKLFSEGVADLFNEITSYYNGNDRWHEGWKTNKNWKINKKVIYPYGVKYEDWCMNSFSLGSYRFEQNWIDDLDRIVRHIKPINKIGDERDYFIKSCLDRHFDRVGRVRSGEKFNNVVETPYFRLKFYKKGTLHIEFLDRYVLDRLNQLGGQLRMELGYEE